MTTPEPSIRVAVDPTNPGQFFACCGLLELADRLWGEAEGWFVAGEFLINAAGGLAELIEATFRVELIQLDPADATASPIGFARNDQWSRLEGFRLDWWRDERAGGKELKVWAGSMESFRIARAMQHTLRGEQFRAADLFNVGVIAYDPLDGKKKEPFYFDARRAPNAHSRDVGFSPNDLQMTTTAYPAVELLCVIGLQRCLPTRTDKPRVFRYHTWPEPLSPQLMAAAVPGFMPVAGSREYQFENWYRTGQRKHKAFRSATLVKS